MRTLWWNTLLYGVHDRRLCSSHNRSRKGMMVSHVSCSVPYSILGRVGPDNALLAPGTGQCPNAREMLYTTDQLVTSLFSTRVTLVRRTRGARNHRAFEREARKPGRQPSLGARYIQLSASRQNFRDWCSRRILRSRATENMR